jgi:hypothetical protein
VEASRNDNFNCIGELELGAGRIAYSEEILRAGSGPVDGYEIALWEVVDAKVKYMPIPHNEGEQSLHAGVW